MKLKRYLLINLLSLITVAPMATATYSYNDPVEIQSPETNQNALWMAIYKNDAQAVEQLLRDGSVDVNEIQLSTRDTPLTYAIQYQQFAIFNLLLNSRWSYADINQADGYGITPIAYLFDKTRGITESEAPFLWALLNQREFDVNAPLRTGSARTFSTEVLRNGPESLRQFINTLTLNDPKKAPLPLLKKLLQTENKWDYAQLAQYITEEGLPLLTIQADEKSLEILENMLQARPDILEALKKKNLRIELPPLKDLEAEECGGDYNTSIRRIRCGEECMAEAPDNDVCNRGVLVHEIGHAIEDALRRMDPSFHERLTNTYKAAQVSGLWQGQYAMTKDLEYWAEGVRRYFDCAHHERRVLKQFGGFGSDSASIYEGKAFLKAYDPALFALIHSVFQINEPDVCANMQVIGHEEITQRTLARALEDQDARAAQVALGIQPSLVNNLSGQVNLALRQYNANQLKFLLEIHPSLSIQLATILSQALSTKNYDKVDTIVRADPALMNQLTEAFNHALIAVDRETVASLLYINPMLAKRISSNEDAWLHWACTKDDTKLLETLLQYAPLDITFKPISGSFSGLTPLEVANRYFKRFAQGLLKRHLEILELESTNLV